MNAALWIHRLVLALALWLVLPTTLAGQQAPCSPRTFHEMYRCAVARYQRADADHRQAYQEAVARLEAYPRGKLRKAEEAWLRYRERQCDFESARSAGRREIQVVRLRCMAELTEARTAMLRAEFVDG
jgi:uncharacterized protein YecT (DUF1311 family)